MRLRAGVYAKVNITEIYSNSNMKPRRGKSKGVESAPVIGNCLLFGAENFNKFSSSSPSSCDKLN